AAARTRLARRISRTGCLLSASMLTGLLVEEAQAISPALANSTELAATSHAAISPHVISLVEGVLTSMWLSKFKMVPAILVLAVALGGGLAGRPDPAHAGIPDDAKKQKKEVGASVHGTVSSIDADKGAMTLTVQVAPDKKQTEEKSFTL